MTDRPAMVRVSIDGEHIADDMRPCMGCAATILTSVVAQHGRTAGLNTMLAAVRLFVEAHVNPGQREAVFRAVADLMRAAADDAAIGPTQGSA